MPLLPVLNRSQNTAEDLQGRWASWQIRADADHDGRKGAVEDDSPDLDGAPGLDGDGLPNDATAIAQDALGARVDQSQG